MVSILPMFFFRDKLYGDDIVFHINRLLSLDTVWKSPINFTTNGGTGQLINTFYPWLTYYPIFIIYKLTQSVFVAWMSFQFLLAAFEQQLVIWNLRSPHNSGIRAAELHLFHVQITAVGKVKLFHAIKSFLKGIPFHHHKTAEAVWCSW